MTKVFSASEHPHRRFNPLLGEWVLISPHRAQRPWQGQVEAVNEENSVRYDESCFLCPTNTRINGEVNPKYTYTFVFKNDFAALKEDTPITSADDPLFKMSTERGECRVICFSPDHSRSIPELSVIEITAIVETWKSQCEQLAKHYNWIQVFENKGAIMGCSNPHPHGQIWAQEHLPSIVEKKQAAFNDYSIRCKGNLLADYAKREIKEGSRVVVENTDWLVVVPYWAAWPFETLLLPKFSVQRMTQLSAAQSSNLADILQQITIRYDNLFATSFPYSMGWHGAPYDGKEHKEWTLHASFFPPLLRSATVKKFMVGYEMMAEPQRDLTPEQAAERLRQVASQHYKKQRGKN